MKSANRHNVKTLLLLLLVALTLPLFSFAVMGEEITVFVSASGNDGAQGTEDAPFQTLTKAISTLSAGGTIVIKDNYTIKEAVSGEKASVFTAPKHTGTITITSLYGGKDYRQTGAALHLSLIHI